MGRHGFPLTYSSEGFEGKSRLPSGQTLPDSEGGRTLSESLRVLPLKGSDL